MCRRLSLTVVVAISFFAVTGRSIAQQNPEHAIEQSQPTLPTDWLETLTWRCIGPANMSGRITAIAVYEKDSSMWWAATASGGLLKTTNNGVSFEHQFDREATVSIGDVAVCQSDPNIVWVGTGEHNPRNSASWGDGVYKSTDGGKTWKNMGLKNTYQIGRIAIHPTNPNIVYVGSIGRLWGSNEDRGLYKTADGGKTWEKILYVDDKTGVIDMQMSPADPDTLLVATYERKRDGFDGNDPLVKFGAGAAIYRTTDGGKTMTKVTGGLPKAKMGRIGLSYYRKDQNVVYAVIETEKIGQRPETSAYAGVSGENAEVGARVTNVADGGPAEKAKLKIGDIIISVDEKTIHSYDEFTEMVWKHKAGDVIKLEVSRDRESVKLELTFDKYPDESAGARGRRGGGAAVAQAGGARGEGARGAGGGEGESETAQPAGEGGGQVARGGGAGGGRGGRGGGGNPFTQNLGGQNPNLQERQGDEGYEYGGVFRSDDGGQNWTRINSLNPRPMYFSQVRVDPSDNKYLYVLGVELYKSEDGGKTFTSDNTGRPHADSHALWIDPKDGRHQILGGDGGIYVSYDRMAHWDHLNHVAIGQFYFVSVGPERNYRVYGGLQDNSSWGGPSRVRSASGPGNTDWFQLGGGDGFLALPDPNDKDQIYYESQNGAMGRINLRTGEGGQIRPQPAPGQTFRFNWKTPFMLSPHNSQIFYSAGNYVFKSVFKGSNMRPISPEISTTEQGTGSAMSESPVEEGVLYVGTTDGNVWVTRNGADWVNVFDSPDQLAAPAQGNRRGRGQRGGRGRGGEAAAAAGGQRGEGAAAQTPAIGEQTQPAQRPQEDTVVGRGGAGGVAPGGATPTTQPAAGQQEVRERVQEQVTGQPAQGAGEQAIGQQQVADVAAATGGRSAAKFLRELVPGKRWVSSVHASKFVAGRAYLTLDGHRSNDEEPYLFMTEDYGRTWRSIRANLPKSAGTVHVLREDIVSQNVLYLGCEFSVWVSVDRGQSWTKFNNNLPTVAVHEFALHPTAGEIVAATHGRSLWIADVTHIRQLSEEAVAADAHLYKPNTVVRWRREPARGSAGTRAYLGEAAPANAAIYYSLGKDAQSVELTVSNLLGDTFFRTAGETDAGMHRVTWNLSRQAGGGAAAGGGRGGARRGGRGAAARGGAGARGEAGQRGGGEAGEAGEAAGERGEGARGEGARGGEAARGGAAVARGAGGGAGAAGGGGGNRGGRGRGGLGNAATGSYLVTLTVDGVSYKQELAIEVDPDYGAPVLTEDGIEWLEEMQRDAEEEEMRERMGGEEEEEFEQERERERRGGDSREIDRGEFERRLEPSQV